MQSEYFHALMARNKKLRNEKSYELNMEVFFSEFFENDQYRLNAFIEQMKGKCSLEIGPSCATLLGNWWFSKKNYVIEPLFEKIQHFQMDKFGYSIFENTENFSAPAEKFIPDLNNAIDGAVVCRNCIDPVSYTHLDVYKRQRVTRPSYLDIGAHHPTHFSNTYFFYATGSSGVTVEPDPTLHAQLRNKRPNDVHLNVGVG